MPPLDAVLRGVLGCPDCKGPLSVHEVGPRTEVHCPACRLAWPVEDGIPQLVPECRRPLPEAPPSERAKD